MKTVLAVDDDRVMLELLDKCLAERGCQLHCVHRVAGAYEAARAAKPDVIVLDVMLPDGAGYQVARQILRDSELFRVPILFVSSFGDTPEVEYALRQGGDDYLVKPFTLRQFLEKLDSLEQLRVRMNTPDACSGLRGITAFERELNHALFRRDPFVFCHFNIRNLSGNSRTRTREDTEQVIRWCSDLLVRKALEMRLSDARFCYLGNAHFAAIMGVDDYRKYCHNLLQGFKREVRQFYRDFEWEQGYSVSTSQPGTFEANRLMQLHIITARADEHEFAHAHDVLRRFEKVEEDESDNKPLFRFLQGEKW